MAVFSSVSATLQPQLHRFSEFSVYKLTLILIDYTIEYLSNNILKGTPRGKPTHISELMVY